MLQSERQMVGRPSRNEGGSEQQLGGMFVAHEGSRLVFFLLAALW